MLHDNNALGTILTFIGTGLAIDALLISFIRKFFSFLINPEEYRRKLHARRELKRIIKSELKINYIASLGNSWGEYEPVYRLYLKKPVIISRNMQKAIHELKLENSYLLTGGPGSGKSTYLRKLFFSRNKQICYILFNHLTSRIIMYFDATILLDGNKANEIKALIGTAKYKTAYLICDGLDELGEQESIMLRAIDMLYELHQAQYNGKMNLIVGGRTTSIQKYLHSLKFKQLFNKEYIVSHWSDADINSLAQRIGEILPGNKSVFDKLLSDKEKFAQLVVNNPMRCKMLCIVALESKDQTIAIENQYALYFQFFEKLFSCELQRTQNIIDYEKALRDILEKLGQASFRQYQKTITSSARSPLNEKDMLKNWSDQDLQLVLLICDKEKKEFLHHTYAEFFVAYHYLRVVEGCSVQDIGSAVEVLSYLYNNTYADFITQGFSLYEGNRNDLIRWFVYIYSFTLPEKQKQDLRVMKEYALMDILPEASILRANQRYISDLFQERYLYLKYEITFRVGRFWTEYAIPFLRFAYFKDTMALYTKNPFTPYELAILKRQCAVSASFICGTDIELDYVNRMLPKNSLYDANYDLVNRSHTLIYYGDVLPTDLLSFTDDGVSGWDCARNKRIARLRKQPVRYTSDDRISCFRLFDLATIYTFLFSRKGRSTLTPEERQVIEYTAIRNIQDMPTEREELMLWIQKQILQLGTVKE